MPLDQKLPEGQAAPEHGEIEGKQRKWSPDQYVAMWEKEQGREMTEQERKTIKRGCIGITAYKRAGKPANPLFSAEKVYCDFERALAYMVA